MVGGGLAGSELEALPPLGGGGFVGQRAFWIVTFFAGSMDICAIHLQLAYIC